MYFERMWGIIKKIPFWPVLSYLILDIFLGLIVKQCSDWGNLAFIAGAIVLPILAGILNQFTGGKFLESFIEDWKGLPTIIHILIIGGVFALYGLYYLYEQYKNIPDRIYGIKQIASH